MILSQMSKSSLDQGRNKEVCYINPPGARGPEGVGRMWKGRQNSLDLKERLVPFPFLFDEFYSPLKSQLTFSIL